MNFLFSNEEVITILDCIPSEYAIVIMARYGIDMPTSSVRQLAAEMNTSEATIRYRLKCAKRDLYNLPTVTRDQQQKEAQERQWHERPETIPYGETLTHKGEFTWVRIFGVRNGWSLARILGIQTLGDLATILPQEFREKKVLTEKGIAAVAELLHSFDIPYEYAPLPLPLPPEKAPHRSGTKEAIIDQWQAVFDEVAI